MLGYLLRVKDIRRTSALTLLSRSGLEFSCWKSAVTGTEVLKAFLKNPWPDNVWEFEHTMEHAFVMCSQNIITLDHLPPDFMSAPGIEHRSPDETQAVDSHAILEALDKTAWNKAKAARLLGIDRVTLYRKIKRYNLNKDTLP